MSRAKRRANRLNAQKSTGPKTPEGKAVSSQNAITHGVFCRNLLLASESAEELEALRHSAIKRFHPRDGVEGELIEQYLFFAWRLKRLRKTEMQVYLERQGKLQQRLREHQGRKNLFGTEGMTKLAASAEEILQQLLEDESGILDKLSRYEQRMFNSMLRCTRELRMLQQEELKEECEDEVSEANAQNEATEAADDCNSGDKKDLHDVVDRTGEPCTASLVSDVSPTIADDSTMHESEPDSAPKSAA